MAAVAVKRSRYQNARATYGSNAYDLDYVGGAARTLGGSEVLQPRPLVRPRERAAVRPKVRVREAGQVSLFAVAGALAIGVFAVLVLMAGIRVTTISDDIAGLNKQMTALQSEEGRLRTQYELAFDLSGIEANLAATGAMVKPQSEQIIYLDISEPDSVVLFDRGETPLKGAEGALAAIGQVLSNVVEYFR